MATQQRDDNSGLTRREALTGLGAGAAVWLLRGTVGPDSAQAVGAAPAGLPAEVVPYQRVYEN